jgi:hypothetical protein
VGGGGDVCVRDGVGWRSRACIYVHSAPLASNQNNVRTPLITVAKSRCVGGENTQTQKNRLSWFYTEVRSTNFECTETSC